MPSINDTIFNRNLKLINESIEKWKAITYHGKKDNGRVDCSLCRRYNTLKILSYSCINCPITIYTKEKFCKNTPYQEWLIRANKKVLDQKSQMLATRELCFLYELRLWWINRYKSCL